MIRFLAGSFCLFEIDEEFASASLTECFARHRGYEPDFSKDGDAVTGFHAPGDDFSERSVVLGRRANRRAVRRALALIMARYHLNSIRVVTASATPRHSDDWAPEALDREYDLDGV